MLEARDIIKKPLVTEKGTYLQDAFNQYSFLVHPKANRLQVKAAVEQLWKVEVTKVRTMIRKGKPRRYRMHAFTTPAVKRAIVTLKSGDKIEFV